jgi:hypothetical protein
MPLELVTNDGFTQMTGIRIMDVTIFAEIETKGLVHSNAEAYATIKGLLST